MNRFTRRTTTAGLLATLAAPGLARAADKWDAWKDLLKNLPKAKDMNDAREKRARDPVDMDVQNIADASGEHVNFDRFGVKISKMPTGALASPEKLLDHVRIKLNDFLDPALATVAPYAGDEGDWKTAGPAPIGSVMVFKIKVGGPIYEGAAVVTSVSGPRKWIFSPVSIGIADPGDHPVSGNREFAIAPGGAAGSFVIYTRGADRALDTLPSEDTVFDGGEALWVQWQAKVAAFIKANGGQATVEAPVVLKPRPKWTDVKGTF